MWIRIVLMRIRSETDPDPAQNLDPDPDSDPDPGGGGGVGQPKMCIPPGKILGTPLRPGSDPLVRGIDPDPDPSIIEQKY